MCAGLHVPYMSVNMIASISIAACVFEPCKYPFMAISCQDNPGLQYVPARLKSVRLGAGIHGSFTAEYLGPRTEEEGKTSTYDIRQGVVDEQGQPKYS